MKAETGVVFYLLTALLMAYAVAAPGIAYFKNPDRLLLARLDRPVSYKQLKELRIAVVLKKDS